MAYETALATNTIHIAVATDAPYQQHLGVMLCSLFENNPDTVFSIHIIIDFERDAGTRKLAKIASRYKQTLRFYTVTPEWGGGLNVNGHVTQSTYYRLLLADLLPSDVDRVIYFDSDLLVLGPVDELWNVNLSGYAIGAVGEDGQLPSSLGLPNDKGYFNAGVLVLDLASWRKHKLGQRVSAYALANADKLHYWDQDALNAHFLGKWHRLPPQFNVSPNQFLTEKACGHKPIIFHFAGMPKPWQMHYSNAYKSEYYYYLSKTPFKRFREPGTGAVVRVKKTIKKMISQLGFE